MADPEVVVSLAAVIVAVTDEQPRVLTVSVPADAPLEGRARAATDAASAVLETLRRAGATVADRPVTEASGGLTLDRIAAVAATGIDLISLGALTDSAPALDVSLEVTR